MIYHTLVYGNEGVYRGNDFLLHAFIRDKSKIPEVLELTRQLLAKYGIRQPNIRYYGIERLPINTGEGWFFFISKKDEQDEWGPYRLSLVEKGGSVDLPAIEKYKSRRLTIDCDIVFREEVTIYALKVVNALSKLNVIKDYVILETPRGFHVRAQLTRLMSLDEKLRIRNELFDDFKRIEYDRELIRLGLPALADILFHEKCWLNENSSTWTCYEENPLLINTVNLSRLDIELSIRELELPELRLRDKVLIFKSPKTPQEAMSVIDDLLLNPMKYLSLHYLTNSKSLTEALVRAYCDHTSWEVCEVIKASQVVEGPGRYIVIQVPDVFNEFVGAMIGRGGSLVKYMEQLLNVKIRIIAKEPEHIAMRKRMRNLMKSLTS